MAGRNQSERSGETAYPRSLQRTIRCRICGCDRKSLGWQHMRMHRLTPEEYKKKFGEDYLFSELLRWEISQANRPWQRGNYRPRAKKEILKVLRAYARSRSPITYEWIESKEPGLGRQAVYAFGSWNDTLRVAGINQPMRMEWSPAGIVREIRRRRALKQALDNASVRRETMALCSAAARHFGSWSKAVESAGLRYADYAKAHRRSPKQLLDELQDWARKNGTLNAAALFRSSVGLARTATRRFGSIAKAAEAAGLPCVSLNPKWSKDVIRERIRERHRRKLTLRPRLIAREDRNLYNAGRKYFKTWTRAVTAAGIDYVTVVPGARCR